MKKIYAVMAASVLSLALTGCDDATVARENMAKAADNFELMRRIVFYNVRLGVNVVTVEGKCSIQYGNARAEYICKLGEGKFIRNFVSDSNDIVAIVEQLDPVPVNVYHFRRTFKPQSIIPDIDFRGSAGELLNAVTPDEKD
jgi:hypothetical protein